MLIFFDPKYVYKNLCIGMIGISTEIPFSVLAFNLINDLNSLSNAAGGNKTLPLYRYDQDGNRIDNITDWGLQQFIAYYQNDTIAKEDIFRYIYGVLHNPGYRQKYELRQTEKKKSPFSHQQYFAPPNSINGIQTNHRSESRHPADRLLRIGFHGFFRQLHPRLVRCRNEGNHRMMPIPGHVLR